MRRNICLIALTFGIIFGLSLLFNGGRDFSSFPVSIRLKWQHQAQFAGIYTAYDRNFYKKEGLDVTILEKDLTGKQATEEVAREEINFAIVSSTEFLTAINSGAPLYAIAAFYQYSPSVILSAKEKNIHTPQDLRGKTLGITRDRKEQRLLVESLLKINDVPLESVHFKEVGINLADALMTDTKIDAVVTYRTTDIYKLNQKNFPFNAILPERYGVDLYNDILITSKKFYQENNSAVRRFLHATINGWEYAFENQDIALRSTLQRTNKNNSDTALQASILKESEYLMKPANGNDIGTMTPTQWDYVYDLFHDNELVGDFEIHNYFSPPYSLKGKK